MPWPCPMRRQLLRCSRVASARRGDHASGAVTSRPSASTTWMLSSVTRTSIAVASGLTAEMGIPRLQKHCTIFDDQKPKSVQLVRSKAAGLGNTHRIEPELRDIVSMLNVNVRRLRSFQTIEKEPKAGGPQYGRHQLAP